MARAWGVAGRVLLGVALMVWSVGAAPRAMEAPAPAPWRVIPVKIAAQDGAPGCLLMTGYETAGGPDYRVWGIRLAQTEMRLILSAARPEALDGDAIAIGVGGTVLATVTVNDRPAPAGPLRSAMASVGTASQRRILDRLQPGATLTFRLGATEVAGVVTEDALVRLRTCLAGVRPNAL